MSHANAALTPVQRLRIGRLVVDGGWPVAHAAAFFHVSWPTAKRWADRYAAMGRDGMQDRSSRPHRSPTKTRPELVRKVVHLRWKKRLGPVGIGARLGMPASTVHAVLTRCRLNRLHHVDVRTGEPVRRYEHEKPGDLIHVDVKKIGNIPDGGGWRYVGRTQGNKNRQATPGTTRSRYHHELLGTAFVHTVIDDHSRVAYAEIHGDETAATAVGVLKRAVSWFADRGVTVERVLSD
ncbi:MAG: family transposase, partial [Microbacteriaceae bacterium]|nr:family transposase [Microbacteriaceae bacterium]